MYAYFDIVTGDLKLYLCYNSVIILLLSELIFMKKVYNKLVRDKIPEIISSDGKDCKTEILNDTVYIEMLDKKLNEELEEYQSDKNIEELADLLEVIYSVTKARGYTIDQLENIRRKKAEEKGSFDKKILLKEVTAKG